MADVLGLKAVLKAFSEEMRKARPVTVSVGYTQAYALVVHERLGVNHPTGNAKYLEGPARRNAAEIRQTIHDTYARTRDMVKSVTYGGLLLQRLSQQECPVDTGALKNSAFTRVEE